MSGYLKTDMSKLSFAEAWRMGGWGYVLVLAGWKLRREPRYAKVLLPAASALVRVEPDEIAERPRAALAPVLEELQRAGFETAFWYRVEMQGPVQGAAAAAINRAGDILGTVTYVEYEVRNRTALSLVSVPEPGVFLTTGNGAASFTPPPSVQSVSRHRASAGEILGLHSRRLRRLRRPPVRIPDAEQMILELQTVFREDKIRRGLYVPA
ncbi:MAG TPA: hypothetical protein VFR03_17550 [Thermoanaerobaculia bacterium]|nr:hypothetical protein [Thermoanaerobaculia bacterium]